MDYFILKQDRDLTNAIKIKGFSYSDKTVVLKENEDEIMDCITLPILSNESSVFQDYIDIPMLLVSDELRKVFELYENTIAYKLVYLLDSDRGIDKVYRLVLPDMLDCLSDKTTYLKNGWVDKIVLDKSKIGNHNIFHVKAGLDTYFVVSLDVAESILKRNFIGIDMKKVEVI